MDLSNSSREDKMQKESSAKNRANVFNCFCVVLVCLLVSLEVLQTPCAAADNESKICSQWKKYKEFKGIIGYERDVKGTKYLETRAEAIIDAPIEILLAVLEDIPSYPQWMYKCKQSILLELEGENKRVLYFSQGVPLGSPDRDAIIVATTAKDLKIGNWVITLNSIDDYPYEYPAEEIRKKHIRMIEFRGVWDLQMIDRDRTKVIYTAYTYPGGIAPKFIVNGVIRKVSFRSLKAMIPLIKEKKYIEAAEKGDIKKRIEAAIENGSLVFVSSVQSEEIPTTGVSSPN